ncbi:MAG: hypothetical protein QXP55_05405 [Nitrososphaerales archaeon]
MQVREICPSCNQLVNVVHVEDSGNATVITYSCGHKNIIIEKELEMKLSLGIKLKN